MLSKAYGGEAMKNSSGIHIEFIPQSQAVNETYYVLSDSVRRKRPEL